MGKRANSTYPEGDIKFKDYKTDITYDEHYKAYNIFLTEDITAPEDYTNVFNTFLNAREDETIRVILCTQGGRLDTTNKIRGLALMTQANTVAVVGDVASAGTILALSFDEMVVLPNTQFMIHNYSGGAWGKGHELLSQFEWHKQEMPRMFREFYAGFLTEEEMEDIIKGNDMYLNAEQVMTRWQNVIKAREAETQQDAQAEQDAQNEALIEILKEQGFTITKPSTKKTTKKA